MATKHKLNEARDLVDKGQREDDVFGKTASAIIHWADKYGDYRSAWFHGVLYHLEAWLELAEVSTVHRTYTPKMATAIDKFVERMLD